MTVPAVIVAGGLGRRMGGRVKALLPLGPGRVIDATLARLAPQAGPLALNVNGDAGPWAGLGLPLLRDPLPGHPGPLAGVLAAMDWAAGLGAAQVLTVPGDTPFLPPDLVARLAGLPGDVPVLAEDAQAGLHPLCALWPVALAPELRAALESGERRVAVWAVGRGAVRARFAAAMPPPFFNINTPEDLAQAAAWVSR